MKFAAITASLLALVALSTGCQEQKKPVEQQPLPSVQTPDNSGPMSETTPLPGPGPMTAQPVNEPAPAPAAPAPKAAKPRHGHAAPAAAAEGTYVVKPGDTLFKIAREQLGDAHRVKDIIAANPGIDPNKLKVGQTINMPK